MGVMLKKWHDDKGWFSQNDLRRYANELWVTKEKFEQQLKEQQTAMQIELKTKNAAFVSRVDSIRSNAAFRIQALETALIETKLKYRREAEQA